MTGLWNSSTGDNGYKGLMASSIASKPLGNDENSIGAIIARIFAQLFSGLFEDGGRSENAASDTSWQNEPLTGRLLTPVTKPENPGSSTFVPGVGGNASAPKQTSVEYNPASDEIRDFCRTVEKYEGHGQPCKDSQYNGRYQMSKREIKACAEKLAKAGDKNFQNLKDGDIDRLWADNPNTNPDSRLRDMKDKIFLVASEGRCAELKKRLGHEPSYFEVYMAHQQGTSGAAHLLKDPQKKAIDALTEARLGKNYSKEQYDAARKSAYNAIDKNLGVVLSAMGKKGLSEEDRATFVNNLTCEQFMLPKKNKFDAVAKSVKANGIGTQVAFSSDKKTGQPHVVA